MVTFEGLPGAVAVSHLTVYDWPAADGLRGGTPYLHLTCSEGYVVIGGTGSVQTLTTTGFRQSPWRLGPSSGSPRHDPPAGQRRRAPHRRAHAEQRAARGRGRRPHPAARPPHGPGDLRRGRRPAPDGTEAEREQAARARGTSPWRGSSPCGRLRRRAIRSPSPRSTGPPPPSSAPAPRSGAPAGSRAPPRPPPRPPTSSTRWGAARGPPGRGRVHERRPVGRGRFGMCGRLDVYQV